MYSFIHLFINLFIHLFIYLSIYLFMYIYIYMAWLGFKQKSSLGQLLENPNMQHPADLVSHLWPHKKGRNFMLDHWSLGPLTQAVQQSSSGIIGFSGDIWGIPLEMSNQNPFGNIYGILWFLVLFPDSWGSPISTC